MNIYAVLLAAGASQRFGAIKQLAEVGGQSMVSIALSNTQLPEISQTFVVLGANADRISAQLPIGVTQIEVADWSLGMGHSLATAVRHLPNDASHVLVTLVDQVAITLDDISQLLCAAQQWSHKIVAARYGGSVGVPAVFPAEFFSQLCSLSGDRGAKSLMVAHQDQLVGVDMPKAEIDIDTPDELRRYSPG